MFDLLKDTYNSMESLKGKRLIYTLIAVFIPFTIIGISFGYLMSPRLSQDEKDLDKKYLSESPSRMAEVIEAEGRITYVNPEMYPTDKISFVLTDYSGKEIYLLSSKDEKLKIAEGLTAKVRGTLGKSADGKKDVLIVEEVIVKSVSD
jgi:hypothetical protein